MLQAVLPGAKARQGGGKGWPSRALTLPAQPPASWRTSERTFVWAAKLNLPPSCQGIGKAVRGEEKGESGEGAAGGRDGGGRETSRLSEPQLLGHCLPRKLAAPRQELPGLGTPKQGPISQASRGRRWVPDALGLCREKSPHCMPRWLGRGGRGKQRRKKLVAGRGVGQGGSAFGLSLGMGGGAWVGCPGALRLARPPARVVYIPGVSFKPGVEAGSWPSPEAPGQSPVKICWRTMASGRRPPLARAPAAPGRGACPPHRALSPPGWLPGQMSPAGEGATRARCPLPRRRGRAPHCFSPQPRRQQCETGFQSPPPPQFQSRPGPPISAGPGLPLPRGRRRRRRKGRKNTGKLLSYLQPARAHTRTSSLWAPLLAGAARPRGWP